MTDAQFDALAQLLRLRRGQSREVSRLVLVQGLSVPDAAKAIGMDYVQAAHAIQRARKGLELAREVVA